MESVPSGRYSPQDPLSRTVRAARSRGLRPVIGDLARFALRRLEGPAGGSFLLDGTSYSYLTHTYKHGWLTERAVEVPVAQAVVDRHRGARILEVGNVLSHYRSQEHTVVDKYERAPGVINRDVLDLRDLGPFDLIVAVSTLEHVGLDEEPRDPDRALTALRELRGRLAPGGRLLVTVPPGYNADFDRGLQAGVERPERVTALRRRAGETAWVQVAPAEAWRAPYDFLLYSARAVLFLSFTPQTTSAASTSAAASETIQPTRQLRGS